MKCIIELDFDKDEAKEENIKKDLKQILDYGGLHNVNSLLSLNIKWEELK